MRLYENEQSGRSMVEMLGVLAIVGVLTVAGIAGYSKAMGKYKVNKTSDQISMLVANIRTLYSGQRNYAGLTNITAASYGVVPNEMIIDATAGTLANAFSGVVTIASPATPTGGTVPNGSFTVKFDGLSKDTCVTLGTSDWGSGSASGLVAVTLGTMQFTGTSLPVSLTDAVKTGACDCTTNSCSIMWEYL